MLERIWAAKRIEELDLKYKQNKAEISHLGKTYNIVTRNTSLIVLENIEDYIRYDITPPEELRQQYEQIKDRRAKEQLSITDTETNRILSLIEYRKKWWDKIFDYKPKSKEWGSDRPLVNSPGNTKGEVRSSEGELLAGVTVAVKNTNKGAWTDSNGAFTIDAEIGDVLILSHERYNSKETTVANLTLGTIVFDMSEMRRTELRDYQTIEESPQYDENNTVHFMPPVIMEVVYEEREMRTIDETEDVADVMLGERPVLAADLNGVLSGNMMLLNSPAASSLEQDPAHQPIAQKIQLKAWMPDAPYITKLNESSDKDLYQTYLSLKPEFADTPSFYLDVAAIFEERGMKTEGFLILSNVAELDLQNYRLIRVLAHRMLQLGYTEYAIGLFEKVFELRPEEPQSYRDLALALEQNKAYQQSIDLYNQALSKRLDGRFSDIEIILTEEMNHVIFMAKENKINVDLSAIDQRYLVHLPVDIRIVLNWDTDNSDMDLWVTDPTDERCYYSNKLTRVGGMISADFTSGYGPEEFLIKKAIRGKYKIQANYYGSREQTLVGPTTIYLDIFTNYGKAEEKKQTIMLRLTEEKGTVDVGEIEW